MIRRYTFTMVGAALLAGVLVLLSNSHTIAQSTPSRAPLAPAVDIGPSFTYQGFLEQGGVAVTGSCDFEFRLYGVATAGTQIGTTQAISGQAIDQGRFTVALNFGAGAIDGQARWLQIAVRCPSGSGAFTTLTPRQVLTATPYALSLRPGAVVAGTVASGGVLNLTNNSSASGDVGLKVTSAPIGVQVDSARNIGVQVNSSGSHGVEVADAGEMGVYIEYAGSYGVGIYTSADDGVSVYSAGTPSASSPSSTKDGFEVAGAEGFGLYVGRADGDGVRIRSTGDDGIQIGEDRVYPNYGLYVPEPGTPNETLLPNTANTAGEWALYTADNISVGNISASAQTIVAVAASDLAAGDVVSAGGLADALPGSLNRLAQVRLADGAAGVIGVVASRVELQPAPGKNGLLIPHSVAGPAKAGDYVALTVLGAVQVKAQAGSAILPGQRVTAGANGAARALQTRTIEGMVVAEGAPTLGVALQEPADGMVWVFVSPQ
ncbi:MAG TPA: hypothetical protein VL334_26640 [Anaerolineae bacterium]|nr:hypothetical protein [Anaerolineae bacterium]